MIKFLSLVFDKIDFDSFFANPSSAISTLDYNSIGLFYLARIN